MSVPIIDRNTGDFVVVGDVWIGVWGDYTWAGLGSPTAIEDGADVDILDRAIGEGDP